MSEWQRLSVREGRAKPFALAAGIPAHLREALMTWVEDTLEPEREYRSEERLAPTVALKLHISGPATAYRLYWIRQACFAEERTFLDVIDVALAITQGRNAEELDQLLDLGDSLWTVLPDQTGIVRRVSQAEEAAYAEATRVRDAITDELSEAWSRTYGRQVDGSDAWDHAIKAVELAFLPIVVPAKLKGTLADVIGQLGGQPQLFAFRLGTSSSTTTSVEAVVQMLRLMWPNPDGHGAPARRRPLMEEAQNVVHLVVLLLNWARSGALTRI